MRIGAKAESVEAKCRDYEKRFPGEENWVAYAGSEEGTLEIAGGGRGVMKFPVRIAADAKFEDYEKIRHLRVHVAGEAVSPWF